MNAVTVIRISNKRSCIDKSAAGTHVALTVALILLVSQATFN